MDEARQILIDTCRRAWKRGLLSGRNGNLSLRLGDACLITRAGAVKGALRPGDIAAVRIIAKPANGLAEP